MKTKEKYEREITHPDYKEGMSKKLHQGFFHVSKAILVDNFRFIVPENIGKKKSFEYIDDNYFVSDIDSTIKGNALILVGSGLFLILGAIWGGGGFIIYTIGHPLEFFL